uniref:C-phycocyanin beta subunit (Fragments) n=1 Tax=Aphanizomenon flos-aquae TaxID=1176 RepID=PHCB_APHFL|nr:RecName: Full=C-phycocyanin beta subunit [Aphanizomenon flos-aquae]
VVSQADARGEFLSTEQLDALTAVVARRLDVVNRITSNASAIVTNAARSLFEEQPNLIAPGGNAYTNRRRDMEIILRYVTYAAIAGDASVLDDRRETYQALGTPGASVAVGVGKGDCSSLVSEVASYFDR